MDRNFACFASYLERFPSARLTRDDDRLEGRVTNIVGERVVHAPGYLISQVER